MTSAWAFTVLKYYQRRQSRNETAASEYEAMLAKNDFSGLYMNMILSEKLPETRLRRLRLAYGYSQARLAEVSGVGLRSIQMYEQRQKNINKAEAESVLKLARALSCEMEDLIER